MPRTSNFFIGTPEGVVKSRCMRRLPSGERGNAELLDKLVGTPWTPCPGQAVVVPPTVISIESTVHPSELPPAPAAHPAPRPRQVAIRKHVELAKYGYTSRCPGCSARRYMQAVVVSLWMSSQNAYAKWFTGKR